MRVGGWPGERGCSPGRDPPVRDRATRLSCVPATWFMEIVEGRMSIERWIDFAASLGLDGPDFGQPHRRAGIPRRGPVPAGGMGGGVIGPELRSNLALPADRPVDIVGDGVNVVNELLIVPRFPEPNSKTEAVAVTRQGGGGATAMVACARLGLRAKYSTWRRSSRRRSAARSSASSAPR
jgi:hypothetical protein